VLQPFAQVDNSHNRSTDGTGLGLPLTKHLVELHGGTMTIRSRLGAGTTVTVQLPPERVLRAVA
jgi:signal transduction histidine kinase